MAERRAELEGKKRYAVLLTWEKNETGDAYLVDFLDTGTRLPLTRQRIYPQKETVLGLVDRSLERLAGPRRVTFCNALANEKRGEIVIELRSDQYQKLTR